MTKFILWRLAQFPLILAVIYLITFLRAWVVPGSPFTNERKINPIVAIDDYAGSKGEGVEVPGNLRVFPGIDGLHAGRFKVGDVASHEAHAMV